MPIMPKDIRNSQRRKDLYTWGKEGVIRAIDDGWVYP